MRGKLILQDGTIFEGKAFGYLKDSVGEVVFNTSMTGYGEVLTDPSYYGQIVTMTYPLIGNYGINLEDVESKGVHVKGFIVREKSDNPNNFRCEMDLDTYLNQNKIIGLEDIDTRALTKILRNNGTMKGIITLEGASVEEVQAKLDAFSNTTAVKTVTRKEVEHIAGQGTKVAVMDFGVKQNILRSFMDRGCDITIFPATSKSEEILSINPDLIFLSNGPGDPEDLEDVIENIKKLVGKKPIAGICLGHQLLALTLGGKTAKLKFGHRGGNHPVKDLEKNKVFITSQNHGYYVSEMPENMVVTHVNLNDNTVEGMKHTELPIYSVQYHPEACPGPKDNDYIFDRFLELV
ncbi:glutamine-hydrolyzing carbamoyl-phosphate synthase small subunit [Romboutsia lituseburensis]|uniref:Carbamoyl phosphate synthase small chain n=1 Tax=Romboutsia lituseburensis DSM 797 TaxID=1121325 RepID=A0A1G9SZE9_9FIRM|nr:glutamine-hydrolyzing carbamoyl-phosphate synthase small subunit [Romboutsia lituseburensis]CEH35979.1 Carbamoyl-phosphate synthase small chain [Romboutsia lituseburensis]SDM40756.1 carbamoyl-phosphate synthase small subunit [Romboutsia lituseburensis DSM 797]